MNTDGPTKPALTAGAAPMSRVDCATSSRDETPVSLLMAVSLKIEPATVEVAAPENDSSVLTALTTGVGVVSELIGATAGAAGGVALPTSCDGAAGVLPGWPTLFPAIWTAGDDTAGVAGGD